MDNEVVEKVLEFNIKVQTNKGQEKIIRIFDINHIGSSLSCCHDDYDILTKIEFKLDCFDYSMEIISNKF